MLIVPFAGLPFATPFTLHVSWTELLPAPLIVAVKSCAPFSGTDAEVGASVMLSGADSKLTVADALAVTSATLTAVTVTLDAGGAAGAAYKPPVEIVPVAEPPPATPFTCHVTAAFDVFLTVAANCCVAPAPSVTLFGEMDTETCRSFGGVPAYPHAKRMVTLANRARTSGA